MINKSVNPFSSEVDKVTRVKRKELASQRRDYERSSEEPLFQTSARIWCFREVPVAKFAAAATLPPEILYDFKTKYQS